LSEEQRKKIEGRKVASLPSIAASKNYRDPGPFCGARLA
jgi:hypothetical protein